MRWRALDGLRGLAAVVVVVHHALLTQPTLAEPYFRPGARLDGAPGLLTYTPLHLLWGGAEAVSVFFVLSGFVLALPFERDARLARWVAYYPRRLVRLYLPLWAGLAFSVLCVAAVPRTPVAGRWLGAHAGGLSVERVRRSAEVLLGATRINTAFWSLRWEIVFSLLLPLFLAYGRWARRWWAVKIVPLLGLVAVAGDSQALRYLPVFGVGVCLAAGRHDLARLAGRVPRRAWWAVLAGVLLLANAAWTRPGAVDPRAAVALSVLGAAGVVALFVAWPEARALGERPAVQWLGAVSFSLYLVHEPVVVSVAYLLGGAANAGWTLLLALPASLLVAAAFHRAVETPATALSRTLGTAVTRQVARAGRGAPALASGNPGPRPGEGADQRARPDRAARPGGPGAAPGSGGGLAEDRVEVVGRAVRGRGGDRAVVGDRGRVLRGVLGGRLGGAGAAAAQRVEQRPLVVGQRRPVGGGDRDVLALGVHGGVGNGYVSHGGGIPDDGPPDSGDARAAR
jgi:peptidoglycan/LPS O-acetylase OafA/YrhL